MYCLNIFLIESFFFIKFAFFENYDQHIGYSEVRHLDILIFQIKLILHEVFLVQTDKILDWNYTN